MEAHGSMLCLQVPALFPFTVPDSFGPCRAMLLL